MGDQPKTGHHHGPRGRRWPPEPAWNPPSLPRVEAAGSAGTAPQPSLSPLVQNRAPPSGRVTEMVRRGAVVPALRALGEPGVYVTATARDLAHAYAEALVVAFYEQVWTAYRFSPAPPHIRLDPEAGPPPVTRWHVEGAAAELRRRLGLNEDEWDRLLSRSVRLEVAEGRP